MTRLADFRPLPVGKDQFPLEFTERRRVLRLGTREGRPVVGLVDPDDLILRAELAPYLPGEAQFLAIADEELAEYLGGLMSDVGASTGPTPQTGPHLDKMASDAPIVNLANSLLLEGLRRGCSDIHIEALPQEVRVRYRIDGVLQTGRTLPQDVFPNLSSRIKILANLDIIERRQPQDGRLSVQSGGRSVEFRVSIVPLAEGESIVLRVFQRHEGVQGLEELGFSAGALMQLRRAATTSHGLVLVTGPTGSGKTTTLNALMREVSRDDNKVITLEDPVENRLAGVNQIQTNEAIGLGFDTLLRRLLRQDPDVLMVGEIRDRVTADLTVRAALTGHLVFSTLHTNDALAAVSRLVDMGVEPFLLGTVVRAVAAQRLVRKLCPACRREAVATPAQALWLGRQRVPLAGPFYAAGGCDQCRGTGYRGRTVAAEVFAVDKTAEELIVAGARAAVLEDHFRSQGHPFLVDDALRLVGEGVTSLAEVERAVFTR